MILTLIRTELGVSSELQSGRTVYTIGHSNHAWDHFLQLLQQAGIDAVADVRSEPRSRYAPHFDAEAIRRGLSEAGIAYAQFGDSLGGRPADARYYDADGHVRYDRLAASPAFLAGIARLSRGVESHRVALLCSEEDPVGCHRRLLVGRVLRARGLTVLHIRGDGTLETEEDVAARAGGRSAEQLTLFDDDEVTEWRSTRSVLAASRQRSSSES